MREKAVIGDDGSQVSRKGLFTVVRTNLERLEPMPFRTQLQGCEVERQKLRMSSRCEVIRLRRHSPFIFHIKLCKIAIDFMVYCLFYWSVIRCQD